ncbi:MAG: TauD/TfdA family dioxygenase [Alphaproteobacteria bacterium]
MNAPAYRSFAEQALHYFMRPHEGVPERPIDSPAAWRGPEMAARPDVWQYAFTDSEIAEIETDVAAARERGVPMQEVTASDVPLAELSPRIEEWRRELMAGRGFILLRGLPVRRWGDDFSAYAYWCLGHHLGQPGAQNPQNELLGHVTDYGEEAENPAVRRYRTAGHIAFHCDLADAVGLMCLRPAKSGGQSLIASSVAIFNEIMRRRPDLIPRLFEPFRLDRRGEQRADDTPWLEIQPCCFADGRLRTFYHSDYFRSVTRHEDVPPFTEAERDILDLYDELAASPEFHLPMWLEPGDMQFISNHTVVHARTEYEDGETPEEKRHLLRLWLSLD